jgi:hypothetical protein
MFISDLQSKRFSWVWVLFSLKDSFSLPHPIHEDIRDHPPLRA